MEGDVKQLKQTRWIKILVWFVSFLISGFYIVSALGWFGATYMMSSGALGKEATDFWQTLNIADLIVRTSQVILIVVASLFLLFLKKIAVRLFSISLLVSLLSTIFVGKWGISFLGGLPSLIILAFVCLYTYLLNRRGFLH